MLYMNYGVLPLFLLSASIISFGFFVIAKSLYEKYKFETIEHLGRVSLLVMVLHLYIMQVAGHFIQQTVLRFVVTMVVSGFISFLIEKHIPILYRMKNSKG